MDLRSWYMALHNWLMELYEFSIELHIWFMELHDLKYDVPYFNSVASYIGCIDGAS